MLEHHNYFVSPLALLVHNKDVICEIQKALKGGKTTEELLGMGYSPANVSKGGGDPAVIKNWTEKVSGAKLDFKNNKFPNISKMSKNDMLTSLPDGWEYTENNGFIHVRDSTGKVRMKIDPPDKNTNYDHVHLFDNNENPIDINGNIVDRKSKDAHIPFGNQEEIWKK